MSHLSRRTFAIISHPDAGKTTLTERLLLFGGAIRLAGQVKAKKNRALAKSDWMEIEQARGISVTTSVMTFVYDDINFNLLDTPGHQDFSEDTYRTLTAVDSAVMVIDAAKGIETQTRKLFEVCRLRDTPILTFINKMDRETRDPFALLDEISHTLALDVFPVTWPIGMGADFRGCYDIVNDRMIVFESGDDKQMLPKTHQCTGLDDPVLKDFITEEQHEKLKEDVGLIKAVYPTFDLAAYREGHLTPVYFGSAIKNFGVSELIGGIKNYAPPPRTQPTNLREVLPDEPKVTGFVFKVQGNMDPNHRDRVAFFRICSGTFKRGMRLFQPRTGKTISIHSPIFFFAQGRELADEAIAGDIIGLPNHGILRVGDTLTEGENIAFTGIPNFAPEILRRSRLADPMKAKHLQRALEDMAEEGVVQVFRPMIGAGWIVGVVGSLQIDVLMSRLAAEYSLETSFEPTPYFGARWVSGSKENLERFVNMHRGSLAEDRDHGIVALPGSEWELGRFQKDFPDLVFSATRERGQVQEAG
ncbi:MAG: peptide chain release factor 3 [Bdellovibrionales bacterium]